MSVEARGGYHYFLTFTDDLSRYGYIYLMKQKSETFEKFKEFQSEFEIGSMYENKVWTLVDLPDDRQAIENKWIFKKTDADSNVAIYKARLIVKGIRQVQ